MLIGSAPVITVTIELTKIWKEDIVNILHPILAGVALWMLGISSNSTA